LVTLAHLLPQSKTTKEKKMSENNQLIVAPYPGNLDRYAIWIDPNVNVPFDFSLEPVAVYDTLDAVMDASFKIQRNGLYKYGIYFLPRDAILGYSTKRDASYGKYLGPDGPEGHGDPLTQIGDLRPVR
jgi:hypothetical protein